MVNNGLNGCVSTTKRKHMEHLTLKLQLNIRALKKYNCGQGSVNLLRGRKLGECEADLILITKHTEAASLLSLEQC